MYASVMIDGKSDRSQIPTCNIMGVNIAAIDMNWLVNYTQTNIKKLSGEYMCVSNVHTTVMSFEDPSYCSIQNEAIMAIPDGGPLSLVGRKRGFKKMDRTTGPSYMDEIFAISVKKGYRHFFFGSTPDTLEKMKQILQVTYPEISIVGMFSPPFRTMTKEEDRDIVRQINEVNPDFLWVGLGAPKQEKWMAAHKSAVKGFMIGVGAGFDYIAGNIDRAPMWMQKNNLEWLYRLIQDPKRLLKRYLITNTKFIWFAVMRGK